MRRALCGAVLIVCSTALAGAGEDVERMTIRVSPRVARAPGRVVVRATIEPDAGNRAILIVAESTDYYRSSTVHLDGDHAARTTLVQFKYLPVGTYRVSANLLGPADQVLATVRRDVIVADPREVITR